MKKNNNNPYNVDYSKFKDSEKITDKKELLKLQLIADFLKAAEKRDTSEVLAITGLHKSDYSRLKTITGARRFSIDKIIGFLFDLGLVPIVKVKKQNSSEQAS